MTVSTSTNEVAVPSSSTLPQTVSFEFCGNLSLLRYQIKIFIGDEVIIGHPTENITLAYNGEGIISSLWNGVSEESRECRILPIRLWPLHFLTTTERISVSVQLHTVVEGSEIPGIHDLSDTHKINFNFVDNGTTAGNAIQGTLLAKQFLSPRHSMSSMGGESLLATRLLPNHSLDLN